MTQSTNFESIYKVLEDLRIPTYQCHIHPDGTVDSYMSISLTREDIGQKYSGKLPIRFGHINGGFLIKHCGLTTLEGCPHTVTNSFECGSNKLTSLVGGPSSVGQFYGCSYNLLTDLVGSPEKVDDLDCSYNKLTSLTGIPKDFSGVLRCCGNETLFSPEGIRDSSVGGCYK